MAIGEEPELAMELVSSERSASTHWHSSHMSSSRSEL
jgi:hypothetical protein